MKLSAGVFSAVAAAGIMFATLPGCQNSQRRWEQRQTINDSFKISDGSINWSAFNTYFRGINNEIIPVQQHMRYEKHSRNMYGYISIDEGTTGDEVAFTIIRGRGDSADRWTIYAKAQDAANIMNQFVVNGDIYPEHWIYEDAQEIIGNAGGSLTPPGSSSAQPSPGP
jgi:hypothetical protein